jgi:hypothetical protein
MEDILDNNIIEGKEEADYLTYYNPPCRRGIYIKLPSRSKRKHGEPSKKII